MPTHPQSSPPAHEPEVAELIGDELPATLRGDRRAWGKLQAEASDALWAIDLDDRSRRWTSPRFLEALGYPTDGSSTVVTWQDVCDEDDLREFEHAVDEVLGRGGDDIRQSICVRGANGRDAVAEVYGVFASREGDRRPTRLVGLLRNQAGESHLERLLNETNVAARIGAWSINLITEEVFWTRMVYEIHELDPATFAPTVATGVDFYREGYSRERIREVVDRSDVAGRL